MTTRTDLGRLQVGDLVTFQYGSKKALARIIEDRGPLGVNRRRLYRIRRLTGADEPDEFEMPEEELSLAPPPDKVAIQHYLTTGGLVDILRSNLGGGKNEPRVWMTYSPRGNVMHTFTPERGLIGGATVPYFALFEDRVFTGKKDEVVELLGSFGLDQEEAEAVINEVGTGP